MWLFKVMILWLSKRKTLKGRKEIAATYEGVVYYFSMPGNKEYFLKNPSKFEPSMEVGVLCGRL
jgi:YHS domain-containing protein